MGSVHEDAPRRMKPTLRWSCSRKRRLLCSGDAKRLPRPGRGDLQQPAERLVTQSFLSVNLRFSARLCAEALVVGPYALDAVIR